MKRTRSHFRAIRWAKKASVKRKRRYPAVACLLVIMENGNLMCACVCELTFTQYQELQQTYLDSNSRSGILYILSFQVVPSARDPSWSRPEPDDVWFHTEHKVLFFWMKLVWALPLNPDLQPSWDYCIYILRQLEQVVSWSHIDSDGFKLQPEA